MSRGSTMDGSDTREREEEVVGRIFVSGSGNVQVVKRPYTIVYIEEQQINRVLRLPADFQNSMQLLISSPTESIFAQHTDTHITPFSLFAVCVDQSKYTHGGKKRRSAARQLFPSA